MAWIDPEGITLGEISQSEKDKYHDSSYMWNLKNKINKQIETDSEVCREK